MNIGLPKEIKDGGGVLLPVHSVVAEIVPLTIGSPGGDLSIF